MNLWLVLGAWVGVSLPVALFLGGFLGENREETPDLPVLRDKVSPTRLA